MIKNTPRGCVPARMNCFDVKDALFLYERKNIGNTKSKNDRSRKGRETVMRNYDRNVLQNIQKNILMAREAIGEVNDRIYDDELKQEITRQAEGYDEYGRKVRRAMGSKNIEPYRERAVDRVKLKSAIAMNTMLDISTGHMAEMLIQGSNRGITELCKVLNHNSEASKASVELAKELMEFEEEAIERMKKYL